MLHVLYTSGLTCPTFMGIAAHRSRAPRAATSGLSVACSHTSHTFTRQVSGLSSVSHILGISQRTAASSLFFLNAVSFPRRHSTHSSMSSPVDTRAPLEILVEVTHWFTSRSSFVKHYVTQSIYFLNTEPQDWLKLTGFAATRVRIISSLTFLLAQTHLSSQPHFASWRCQTSPSQVLSSAT